MNRFLFLLVILFVATHVQSQIQVSTNRRFLQTKDGKPFFWLGDTDWELFHRLTREEIDTLFETRKRQGFNVIQAVALAEYDGLHSPNRYGDLPLVKDDPTKLLTTPGDDPTKPQEYDYWDHVDFAIKTAADKGLYVGLLPTWGDKVAHLWGDGPIIFNVTNARLYGATLAKRYKDQWNVIWILGGDRPAVYTSTIKGKEGPYDDRAVWRAMAEGIESVAGKTAFITYHPAGGPQSSSQYIQTEPWLDMNAFQSGHGSLDTKAWDWVQRDLSLKPQKPTLDMEPCYEDHPINPWDGKWTRQRGYFTAYDVRARIYRGVFAGSCGVTYGHHQVWQFMNPELNTPVNPGDTIIAWQKALLAEAAGQMQYLKNLMMTRPYFSRIEDQKLVQGNGNTYSDLIIATRDSIASYAMFYLPQPQPITVNLSIITGERKKIYWFDPRTGSPTFVGIVMGNGTHTFVPPGSGKDWVLIVDDGSKNYGKPGILR